MVQGASENMAKVKQIFFQQKKTQILLQMKTKRAILIAKY